MAIIIPKRRGTSTACCGGCCGWPGIMLGSWVVRDCNGDDDGVGRMGVGGWRIPSLGIGSEVTGLLATALSGGATSLEGGRGRL